jgi:NAD(P)-dependent dehydrogenase (short-subunit alcohol dehydrogenase family)
MDMVRQIFETNTIGTFAMVQAVLPQFRARGAGVIVNVTSSVTLKPLTLLSVYTASKAAVNAFTQSLALELAAFGIRAHVVLPGRSPETKFGENARVRIGAAGGFPEAYAGLVESVFADFASQDPEEITRSVDVAEAVWRAVTDVSAPMMIPAGKDAVALMP